MALEILEEEKGGVIIISPRGQIDSNSAISFEQRLLAAIKRGSTRLIVDFQDVDYISSAGLRVFLKAIKELKPHDAQLLLCSVKDYIKEVFELSGFVIFLSIHSTLQECLGLFKNSSAGDKIRAD